MATDERNNNILHACQTQGMREESRRLSTDECYMMRCLQLAKCGQHGARPNPMVGAVIVCNGIIIGEGYHRRCGEAHAEVNAFNSVAKSDEHLLPLSTMYVSLEPCAHYGKTPPCADLIVKKGVKRVVVGCSDSFDKVDGRGIQRLREAGIDVTVGVLEDECRWINRKFFTYHAHHRPYITLKWAMTTDGYIDNSGEALAVSSPFTKMLVHKLRSENDAIVVGHTTEKREHPELNVRCWAGKSPKKYVLSSQTTLDDILNDCYESELQSLIVEGGTKTLQSFIDRNLFDEIRIEQSSQMVGSGTKAPSQPKGMTVYCETAADGRLIRCYKK